MSAAPQRGPKFPLRLDQLKPASKRLVDGAEKQAPAAMRPTVTTPQPQPVHQKHNRSPSRAAPAGLGLDSADVRRQMVQRLRSAGLSSTAVLDALAAVPRHQFVDAGLVTQAYEDTSLPIGHGQTISKPSVVARMIELLMAGANARDAGGLGRVLEIGTGCGYQAALLAVLATELVSIERLRPLHERASRLLLPQVANGLQLIHADGMLGYAQRAPYQSIIAAAGGDALPEIWLEQLALGGRLVAPMTHGHFKHQVLMVVDKRLDGSVRQRAHDGVLFVPLRSGTL